MTVSCGWNTWLLVWISNEVPQCWSVQNTPSTGTRTNCLQVKLCWMDCFKDALLNYTVISDKLYCGSLRLRSQADLTELTSRSHHTTSRSTNTWNDTSGMGSHKILVCTEQGKYKQMHESCFRNSLFTVKGAAFSIATVVPLRGPPPLLLVPSPFPAPHARRSHHPFETCTLAQSVMRLTQSRDDRFLRISAWTQVTLIFSVSPGKFPDGTSK